MTLTPPHKKGWTDANRDCDLCNMEKRTEWHMETTNFVIADTLSGTPFIVSKQHEEELSADRRAKMERLLDLMYDDWSMTVTMDQYPEHWHGHLSIDG